MIIVFLFDEFSYMCLLIDIIDLVTECDEEESEDEIICLSSDSDESESEFVF